MPAGREAAARAVEATRTYGRGEAAVTAIDAVSVAFGRGEFTAIMGASGSGKSTLLHCLAGLDTPTSGHVYIGDTDLTTLGERQLTRLRRDRIGFIFQAFNLVPTLSARENIRLPSDIAGRAVDEQFMDQVVSTMRLEDRLSHRPTELSGGQQQRVAAARALVARPEIVFADEPTGNLDTRAGSELLGFMRQAVDDLGQTIIMVTHDPGAAARADRVIFLADGRVVDSLEQPTADAILAKMRSLGA
jgi:putative ABC transport system ATP-binding protein